MAEKTPSSPVQSIQLAAWRKRHRFSIQSLVFIIALLSPFALYWAIGSRAECSSSLLFWAAGIGVGSHSQDWIRLFLCRNNLLDDDRKLFDQAV
jgi:hypothetical protein